MSRKITIKRKSITKEYEFNKEACALVVKAEVVGDNPGLSCCFTLVSETTPMDSVCFPMSEESCVSVGDILDLSKAKIQIVKKIGEPDRYEIVY